MASNAENEITFAIALMLSGYDHKYNLVLGLSGRYTNGRMHFLALKKTEIFLVDQSNIYKGAEHFLGLV